MNVYRCDNCQDIIVPKHTLPGQTLVRLYFLMGYNRDEPLYNHQGDFCCWKCAGEFFIRKHEQHKKPATPPQLPEGNVVQFENLDVKDVDTN